MAGSPARLGMTLILLRKTPVKSTARSRGGFQRHAVALAFEHLDGPTRNPLRMATVEVVGAQFVVRRPAREHMVRGDEHAVGDSRDRLLVTAVPHNPPVPRGERAVGRPNRGQGGLGQGGPQPAIAPPRLPGLVLAGTLVVAGTQARPTGEVSVT